MGKFSEQLAAAAQNAQSLAASLKTAGDAGGGGGGGGGGSAPGAPPVVFNTTLQMPPVGRTVRMGDGSGTGGKDLQSRAFAYFGLSAAGKSSVFIQQIIRAFEEMLAKGGIQYRTGRAG